MGSAPKLTSFEIVKSEQHLVVQLFGQMSPEAAVEFGEETASARMVSTNVIVDCEHAEHLSEAWVDALASLEERIKPAGFQLRLVRVSAEVAKALGESSIGQTFQVSSSLEQALAALTVSKTKSNFDVSFINPFLASTVEVLQTQASTLATPGKIFRRAAGESFLGEIAGVISIVSDRFSGTFVISFPATTYLQILSRMLGEDYTELNAENSDGVGELTNIIFGQAKSVLNKEGHSIQMALPVVLFGPNQQVSQVTKKARLVVPFQTDVGGFAIEIGLA